MSSKNGPNHVVVDGSNIATEGRSTPSLAQLSEAVAGFMEEYPDTAITVVVDATFGHRIDKKEVSEFEAGISNNELVAPPAGAVGRGDAFVLGIADKAGAAVLSNDSFQEFHGEYTWLFDEGRLIGGKPVPHVGWVWVDRVPVRGPVSRKATRGSGSSRRASGGRSRRGSKGEDNAVRTGSPEASAPMPTPKSPPPRPAPASTSETDQNDDAGSKRRSTRGSRTSPAKQAAGAAKAAPKGGDPVNELMPFLDFVEQHPAGTQVEGTVDSYSSHGAYITIAGTGVRGYVPLRLMADPAPRSAKSVMKIGEDVTVVVVSFVPARRSIDCALPALADAAIAEAEADSDADTTAEEVSSAIETDEAPAADTTVTRKKTASRKRATSKKQSAAKKTAAKRAAAKKAPAKKAPAKKAPAKKSAAKKSAAKKAPAKRAAAEKAPAEQTEAQRTPAKRSAAKKTAAKKSAAKKTPAKKTPAKKTPAKRTPAKKAAAKKTAARKAPTTQAGARKTAGRKAPARKSAGARAAAKKTASRAATVDRPEES